VLGALLEPRVIAVSPELPGGIRPDLMVGSLGEPPERLAIIEVSRVRGRDLAERLRRLDSYLAAADAAQGALILFGSGAPSDIRHVTTPAGRDVLVLRL
jgi:hypothetical protein